MVRSGDGGFGWQWTMRRGLRRFCGGVRQRCGLVEVNGSGFCYLVGENAKNKGGERAAVGFSDCDCRWWSQEGWKEERFCKVGVSGDGGEMSIL
ncbi:unnamed protein product [Camellia sinensis]